MAIKDTKEKTIVARKEGLIPSKLEDQEVVVDTFVGYKQGWGNKKYDPSFCQLAFEILSGDSYKTKAHLCRAFRCSKPTIINWMKRYTDFNDAVISGLAIGEELTREELKKHSDNPGKDVNNGLIKLLAANVYGIKDDQPNIVINNFSESSPEDEMAKRGIPVPSVGVNDIEEDDEEECNEE